MLSIEREGRRIGWTEWGDSQGTPVLFCTGAAMTSSFGFGGRAARALGLRVLCIDRAGLGRSDPDPHKTFATYAGDVEAVLRAEGIDQPAVVGFSQGAPFALALADASLVRAVALVAGTDELAHPGMRSLLVPEVAAMVDAVEADSIAFEREFATRADAEGMWSLVLGMSAPVDRAIYEEPAFASAYRQSLREGFAHGPAGYVRDLTLATARWPMQPETITVPVRLWYGALDTSPVHSPDLGATLDARFPHSVRRVLPDEGASLLWTKSSDILRDLVAAR